MGCAGDRGTRDRADAAARRRRGAPSGCRPRGSMTRARRRNAGASLAAVVPIATVRVVESSASTVRPARRAAAVVTVGGTTSTGTVTVDGSRPSRRTSASPSSARPTTLGSILAPPAVTVTVASCGSVAMRASRSVWSRSSWARRSRSEAVPPPSRRDRACGSAARRCPARSASSSASSMRGCAPRSAPVTVTVDLVVGVVDAEHDRAQPLLACRRVEGGCCFRPAHPADVDAADDGARRERIAPGERQDAGRDRECAGDRAQHDEDDERSPPTAGAGGSGEVHTDDVGQREAPEPRRPPSRRS